MITATIKGTKQLEKSLSIMNVVIRDMVFEEIAKKAFKIHSDAVKSIATPSAGRRYGKHIASKPGKAPNTDTGRLISSIRVQVDKPSETVSVSSNVKYAVWLEFGTKKMAARPWLQPAVDKNKKIRKGDFKIPKVKKV